MTRRKNPTSNTIIHRKGFLSIALPWLKRFGWISGGAIVLIWISAWLIITGTLDRAASWTNQQFIDFTAKQGIVITTLTIDGRQNTDLDLIKALLNIDTNTPTFAIHPKQAQQLLQSTKWIRKAHIERHLPSTIYIKLTERTPIARLSIAGSKAAKLLDDSGDIIEIEDISAFKNLIKIKGKDEETTRAAGKNLITHLNAHTGLYSRITTAQRQGNRRWDLTLKNALTIKLPEDKSIGYALQRLSDAQAKDNIFDQDTIETLDLRFDDRIIVETKPGKASDHKKGRKT